MEGGSGGASRRLARWLFRHRRGVLIAGIVAFIAMLPLAALAPNYINYSSTASAVPNSQSAQVQSLLASSHPEDSTLFVVTPNSVSGSEFCSHTSNFTVEVGQQSITNYNETSSVCSAGARLIDTTYGPNASLIRDTRANMTALAHAIYGYPSNFTNQWERYGFSRASINATYNQSGGRPGYDAAFKTSLFNNYSSSATPYSMVDGAVRANALPFFNTSFFNESATIVIVLLSSVTDYSTAPLINVETAGWLTFFGHMPVPVLPEVVAAFAAPGDPGWNYVIANGYGFVPAAIRAQFVSPDNSTQIIDVVFNVPDTYRGPHNFYPAQAATPEIRDLTTRNFGPADRRHGRRRDHLRYRGPHRFRGLSLRTDVRFPRDRRTDHAPLALGPRVDRPLRRPGLHHRLRRDLHDRSRLRIGRLPRHIYLGSGHARDRDGLPGLPSVPLPGGAP